MLERNTHEQQLQKERHNLDLERVRSLNDKQTQLLQDKAKEAAEEADHMRAKYERLEAQA